MSVGQHEREHIVIVGGGIGGLASALTLSRAGHRVTLLERDELAPTASVEEAFLTERPGAPQAHHTHAFLARTVVTLRRRFPDVLERVLAAGSTTLPAARNLGDPQPGDEDLVFLVVRRTTYEWTLRQAVLGEPNTTVRAGAGVSGLTFRSGREGRPPSVVGVRFDDGTTLDADAVVVATGRRSNLPEWLAEGGVDIAERVHESKLMYLSRWYRRPPSDDPLPESRGMDAGFVKYLAVPGDNDTLSITLAIRPDDGELRRALLDAERFDEACRRLPGPDRFFAEIDLEPVGPVRPMGGLINRLRTFTDESGAPLVLGLHAVGDAHTCTNPIYGRGCSLALVQATLLGDAFAAFPNDGLARSTGYEAASAREVVPWFHASVDMDKMAPLSSDLDARPSDGPPTPIAALFVAAESEPIIGRGLAKLFNLLVTPAELAADAEFTAKSMEVFANPGRLARAPAPRPDAPRTVGRPGRRALGHRVLGHRERTVRTVRTVRTGKRRRRMTDITQRTVAVNGVELYVNEAGERGDPLVVLSHGFPELGYSWRHQMAALADAGYHVLAPDQRGYGRSTRPDAIADYDIVHLTDDLLGLLDESGASDAVFVGHDWGAFIVWHMSLLHPDRTRAVCGMSVPFSPRGPMPPVQVMRQVFADNFFYIVYFQEPGVADAELGADPARTMRRLLAGTKLELTADAAAAAEAMSSAFANDGRGFVERMPEPDGLPGWLSQAELDHYVDEFGRTGFTGGLNWYRNFDRNWELTPQLDGAKVTVPSLFIGGAQDPVLTMMPVATMDGWLEDHRGTVLIDDAGHWVQQEKPAEVNAALLTFVGGLS